MTCGIRCSRYRFTLTIAESLCTKCMKCLKACSSDLIGVTERGFPQLKVPGLCKGCMKCIQVCKTDAIKVKMFSSLGKYHDSN